VRCLEKLAWDPMDALRGVDSRVEPSRWGMESHSESRALGFVGCYGNRIQHARDF
jgi:hypothetical protein